MASRIDVSIEDRRPPDVAGGKRHPNTCPRCGSHYRDDELERTLRVCAHCGHHFPVRARERIAQLADRGTFVEQDGGLRSADPPAFFDLKPYTERLAEAEIEKNAASDSPATARASSVVPVPGGPYSSTPRGILAPSRR